MSDLKALHLKVPVTCDFPSGPLVKLEEVYLDEGFPIRQELVDFFEAMSLSMKLRKLVIMSSSLQEQMDGRSTEVVARAINFLEDVVITVPPYQVSNLHLHIEKFK